MKRQHTLVVLVEDHPGVLNRVVSLLRRRSFNIDSITVGHSEQPGSLSDDARRTRNRTISSRLASNSIS